MQKIKIAESGWDGFTGNLGGVEFVDGISTDVVSEMTMDCLAAAIMIVSVDGDQVGVQQRIIGGASIPAEVVDPLPTTTDQALSAEAKLKALRDALPAKFYEIEELELIGNTLGIGGLREIGTVLDVKGRAIPELIGAILRGQVAVKQTYNDALEQARAVGVDTSAWGLPA